MSGNWWWTWFTRFIVRHGHSGWYTWLTWGRLDEIPGPHFSTFPTFATMHPALDNVMDTGWKSTLPLIIVGFIITSEREREREG